MMDLAEYDALRTAAKGPLTDRQGEALESEHVSDDLAALVERTVDAYWEREDSAPALLDGAATTLQGGERGVEELAAYADDSHAHPHAHALLYGVLASDGDDGPATTLETASFSFDVKDYTWSRIRGLHWTRVVTPWRRSTHRDVQKPDERVSKWREMKTTSGTRTRFVESMAEGDLCR